MVELITRHLDPPREQSCELQEDIVTLARDGFCEGQNPSKYRTRTETMVNYMIEVGLFEKLPNGNLRNVKVLRRLSDAQKKKVRRTDGQLTDTVRCEVKEGKEGEENMNRSEGKELKTFKTDNNNVELNQNEVPKQVQTWLDKIEEYETMKQNPKYGSDQCKLFDLEITRLYKLIQDYNKSH